MSRHREILIFIERIRDSHPLMVDIFTKGSCLNFYMILKAVYSDSIPYDNNDHVITKIGRYFYDINGVVRDYKGYLPISHYPRKGAKQMLRASYKVY